jgi:hypothetical protein
VLTGREKALQREPQLARGLGAPAAPTWARQGPRTLRWRSAPVELSSGNVS